MILHNNFNELHLFHYVLLYVVIACHSPFFISLFPQIYNSKILLSLLIIIISSFSYFIKQFWDNYKSKNIRDRFLNLINQYKDKVKKDNFNFYKNEVIKNVIDKITENLVFNSLENLNLLEHKESMKKILENINQNKIFEEFFQEVDTIIIDYKLIEKDLLSQIIDYSRIKKKKIYLISQDFPFDILKEVGKSFFSIENIITPYQFRKNWFGNYYLSDDISKDYKLDLNSSNLANHILEDSNLENKDVLFIGNTHLKNDSILQICLNKDQKLTNDYFVSLVNDWIEVK